MILQESAFMTGKFWVLAQKIMIFIPLALFLLLGAGLYLLLFSDLILRNSSKIPVAFDRQMLWRPIPHWEGQFRNSTVWLNEAGLRDDPINLPKDPKSSRIICLGGSETFGVYIKNGQQTYPQQLERLLNEKIKGRPIDVINAGIIGYTSFQGVKFLEEHLATWQPNIVIESFLPADFTFTDERYFELPEELAFSDRELASRRQNQAPKFFMAKLYEARLEPLLAIIKFQQWVDPGLIITPDAPASPPVVKSLPKYFRTSWQEKQRSLRELQKLSQRYHFRLILLRYPLREYTWYGEGFHLQELADEGIELLDANPDMFGHAEFFLDLAHLSEAGHARLATKLFDYLRVYHPIRGNQ
jgi:lysophospholipase L1-like esterase